MCFLYNYTLMASLMALHKVLALLFYYLCPSCHSSLMADISHCIVVLYNIFFVFLFSVCFIAVIYLIIGHWKT